MGGGISCHLPLDITLQRGKGKKKLKKWNKQERYRRKPGKHREADSCKPITCRVFIEAFSETHKQIETSSGEMPELYIGICHMYCARSQNSISARAAFQNFFDGDLTSKV